MRFFDWHQRQTEWWLDRLGMKSYAALWFAYLKGVVTTLFVLWVLGYFSTAVWMARGGEKSARTVPGRAVMLLARGHNRVFNS